MNLKEQTYGIDLDGVLAELSPYLKFMIERDLGIPRHSLKESGSYHNMFKFEEDETLEPKIMEYASTQFGFGEVYENAEVIPDSLAGVHTLADMGLSIAYITHRPEATRAATLRWLRKNGYPNLPLYHVSKDSCKSQKMGELNISTIIDDSAAVVESVNNNGRNAVVIRQPYNLHLADSHNRRIMENWDEFLRSLND